MTRAGALATAVLAFVGGAVPSGRASVYTCALTGGTGSWTNPATWSPAGVPGTNDTAVMTNLAWFAAPTVTLDPGWAADTFIYTSRTAQANGHQINVAADGRVRVVRVFDNGTAGGSGFTWAQQSGKTVTLSEYHCQGPKIPTVSFAGGSRWLFTNAAIITYHGSNVNSLAETLDFTGATSVLLRCSAATPSPRTEWLRTTRGNVLPVALGRADGQPQVWSVAPGSHPTLEASVYSQSLAIRKVGPGDVRMDDVDLLVVPTNSHPAFGSCALSASGADPRAGGTLYTGTVTAHSLTLDARPMTNATAFWIAGALVLTSQAGQQGGAAGNGRALDIAAGRADFRVRPGTDAPANKPSECRTASVVVQPGGGEIRLETAGAGKAWLDLHQRAAERAAPVVVANTVNVAGTNAYLSDRDPNNPAVLSDAHGARLELRGSLLNRSVLTNDFRLDHSTLHFVGTNSLLEAPSADRGPVDPAPANFLFGALVLGRRADGTASRAELALTDAWDNAPGAGSEAVYAERLELYAGSVLWLQGRRLYYRNGGLWREAVADTSRPFVGGDGTGYIGDAPAVAEGVIRVK
jgi:hypothetical protein